MSGRRVVGKIGKIEGFKKGWEAGCFTAFQADSKQIHNKSD